MFVPAPEGGAETLSGCFSDYDGRKRIDEFQGWRLFISVFFLDLSQELNGPRP